MKIRRGGMRQSKGLQERALKANADVSTGGRAGSLRARMFCFWKQMHEAEEASSLTVARSCEYVCLCMGVFISRGSSRDPWGD